MDDIAWAVERQIRRFALANDAYDHDAIAGLFTQDGVFCRPTEPDRPVIGREAIREFFRDRPRRVTRHVMANTVVEPLPDGTAKAHSYVLLYLSDKVLVGDFHDRLVEDGGIWLFSERRGTLAFT